MKDIAIIIPAYNECGHIGKLLNRIKSLYDMDIIVVDDCSDDCTPAEAESAAQRVVRHSVNMGKGKALTDGLEAAKGLYRFAILMDADGQHRPEDIASFINIDYGRYDIIIGRRDMNTGNMPLLRYITNRVTSLVVSILSGARVHDSQSGFRMVRIESYLSVPIKTYRFQTESEILINGGRRSLRIGHVPVKTVYGDEISKINPVIDTVRFIKMALEALWV